MAIFNRKKNRDTHSRIDSTLWDEAFRQLLDIHPCTLSLIKQVLDERVGERSYKSIAKRVSRLEKKKECLFLGRIHLNARGRPSDVWERYFVKRDTLEHEVRLSEWLLSLNSLEEVVRGYDVDPEVRPDAQVVVRSDDGEKLCLDVEMDMGTCRSRQVAKRMKIYTGTDHEVIWVAKTERRMKRLMSIAEQVGLPCLFTHLASDMWVRNGETKV